jgi:hypothetical protein
VAFSEKRVGPSKTDRGDDSSQIVPGYIEESRERLRGMLGPENHDPAEKADPADDVLVAAGRRIEGALALYEVAVMQTRERLRRENKDATPDAIEVLVDRWIHSHQGAEHGDGPGRPISPDRWRRILGD